MDTNFKTTKIKGVSPRLCILVLIGLLVISDAVKS